MPTDTIPKVSVIIPLYNKAPYIRRGLDSVLAQTVQDFEIVVVNDGSTDGSENIIVEEYTDARIRLINQENQGVSAARNHGVDAARAELVAFLDADDEWLPEFLETILRLREKWPEAGMYGTGYKTIYTNGRIVSCSREVQAGDRIITNWFAEKNRSKYMVIQTSNMVIPKKIFHEVKGFPLGYSQNEDRYLRARIALLYPVAYSPSINAIYYYDPQTYAHRKPNELIGDAFSNYVQTHEAEIKTRDDYTDIILFCDVAQIGILSINLIKNKDKKMIREKLQNIKSRNLLFHRNYFIFLSYFPIPCIKIGKKGYSAIQWALRKLNNLIT